MRSEPTVSDNAWDSRGSGNLDDAAAADDRGHRVMKAMSDEFRTVWDFVRGVVRRVSAYITGGIIAAAVAVYEHMRGQNVASWPFLYGVAAFLVVAFYQTWRDEHHRAEGLQRDLELKRAESLQRDLELEKTRDKIAAREHDVALFKKGDVTVNEPFLHNLLNNDLFNHWCKRADILAVQYFCTDFRREENRFLDKQVSEAADDAIKTLSAVDSFVAKNFFRSHVPDGRDKLARHRESRDSEDDATLVLQPDSATRRTTPSATGTGACSSPNSTGCSTLPGSRTRHIAQW
jgi:hypothetical protein